MQRIKAADSVAVLPPPTGAEVPGFFSNGPPGTIADDDWFNGVQEELAYIIETIGGGVLSEADLTQVGEVVRGVRAILAFTATSGIVSTPDTRAVIASTLSNVINTLCAVIASTACVATGGGGAGPALVGGSTGCSANGTNSFVGGSSSVTVSGDTSAILAGGLSTLVSGDESAALAARGSTVSSFLHGLVAACLDVTVSGTRAAGIASDDLTVSGSHSAAIASQGPFDLDADFSVALGAIDALFDAGEAHQAAIACTDADIGAGFSAVIASKFALAGILTATQCFVAASEGESGAAPAGASGDNTAVIACKAALGDASNAAGAESARMGCGKGITSGTRAVSVASDDDLNQGINALCAATDDGNIAAGVTEAAIIGVDNARVAGDRAVGLGGVKWELGDDDAVAGGWASGGPAIVFNGTNQNLQFRFDLPNGNLHLTNTTILGSPDFAESFENLAPGVLPVGALVSKDGAKVRLAVEGDTWIRSVSANPCIVGNAAPNAWVGKIARDKWGRVELESVDYVKWDDWRRKGIRWPAVEARAGFDGTLEEAAGMEIPADARLYQVALEPLEVVRWIERKTVPAYDGPLIMVPIPPPAGVSQFYVKLLALPKRRSCVRWPAIPGLKAYHGPTADAPLERAAWPEGSRIYEVGRTEARVTWPEIVASAAYTGPLVGSPEPPAALLRPPVVFELERIESYNGPTSGAPIATPADRVRWPADQALEAFEGLVSAAPLAVEDWPASAELWTVSEWTRNLPKTAPDYDPAAQYVPRLERPEEWTTVALVGQVPIRVDDRAAAGDYLEASAVPGVARVSPAVTSLEVMRIDEAFDEELGYAIAWVLIGAA